MIQLVFRYVRYLLTIHYFTPSMKSVSKVFNNVRTNVISFRVFSNITFVRRTAKKVRRPNHRQVIHVHFCNAYYVGFAKYLEKTDNMDVYIRENYGLCNAHGMMALLMVVITITSGSNYYQWWYSFMVVVIIDSSGNY